MSVLREYPEQFVTVTAVCPTRDEAKAEVDRLNRVQSREEGGGAAYFWHTSRAYE